MTEDMKMCIQCNYTYPSDMFHVRVHICEGCRGQNKIKRDETKKQWKLNNPDKVKAYQQKHNEMYADEIKERKKKYRQSEEGKAKIREYNQLVYHCELCDYDIKKCKKTQHEKSKNHQYFLQKSLNNEKLERPDKKEMYNGIEYFCCLKCKRKEINYEWYKHVSDEEHNKAG